LGDGLAGCWADVQERKFVQIMASMITEYLMAQHFIGCSFWRMGSTARYIRAWQKAKVFADRGLLRFG